MQNKAFSYVSQQSTALMWTGQISSCTVGTTSVHLYQLPLVKYTLNFFKMANLWGKVIPWFKCVQCVHNFSLSEVESRSQNKHRHFHFFLLLLLLLLVDHYWGNLPTVYYNCSYLWIVTLLFLLLSLHLSSDFYFFWCLYELLHSIWASAPTLLTIAVGRSDPSRTVQTFATKLKA